MAEHYLGLSLYDFLAEWDKSDLEQVMDLLLPFRQTAQLNKSFRALVSEQTLYYSSHWKGLYWFTDRYYSALAPVAQIALPELLLPDQLSLTLVIESSKPPRLFCRHSLLTGILSGKEYYYSINNLLKPGNLYLLLESPVQGKIRYLIQAR